MEENLIFCDNCNWIGTEKGLVEVQIQENKDSEYLIPTQCCPNCFNDKLKPFKKEENA